MSPIHPPIVQLLLPPSILLGRILSEFKDQITLTPRTPVSHSSRNCFDTMMIRISRGQKWIKILIPTSRPVIVGIEANQVGRGGPDRAFDVEDEANLDLKRRINQCV
jgi:hypothetical protein